ncbi:MAG: DUF5615 family PIN-like protein [bacterium]
MRVLLDENLPHDLIAPLSRHDVSTVQGMGWAGVENGELLRRASGNADAFITMDRKLERENVATLPFGVVLMVARSNRVQDLLPLVPEVLAALERIQPGRLEQVGA